MGQHDQFDPSLPAGADRSPGLDLIDHDAFVADILPVLERHGFIPPGERLDGWVGILRLTGWDGRHEYRRCDTYTSPGITRGDALQIVHEGGNRLYFDGN